MSLKIVFMGTPEFSVPTLEALIKNKFNVVSVYTQPPAKSKRGQKINASPIDKFSRKNKKVRKLALAQTLSKKNLDKNLHILADVKKEIKKTKEFNKFLEKNNLANALIISDSDSLKNINKSARNIKNVKLIKEEGTNIYDLFNNQNKLISS